MRVDVGYSAIPVHEPFHRSASYERHMFGAFGSGKTYAVCSEAIAWCLEQPGIRGMVTRKTIPELRDTTETVFFDILPDEIFKAGKVSRIGGHYADFTFPNGSKVLFRSIPDWKEHKSLNLGFIAWDEMDEFDEETYVGMKGRLRQRDPTKEGKLYGAKQITRRGTWGASNPGGHNWIWKRFVKEGHGEHFKSTSFDNPFLPPDYYEGLLAMPEPWVKRYVLCQFDDFAGQMYENWSWDRHVVPAYPRNPLTGHPEYPAHSVAWMALDPGMRDPTAGLWVVAERSPVPRLVAVAEYQEAGLGVDEHARAFRRIEARHQLHVRRRIADPGSVNWRSTDSGDRLAKLYQRRGFKFELGPQKWEDRILPFATLIESGKFVVTEDCPRAFEAIRDARWKDLTPAQRASGEDAPNKPLKKDRHLVDCAEYLASRWVKPVQARPAIDENDWSAEFRQAIQRRVAQSGRPKRQVLEGIPV